MKIKLVLITTFLFFAVHARCAYGQTLKRGMSNVKQTRVLDQTRKSYCSLKEHGLLGFEATVKPNFRLILASVWKGTPVEMDTVVAILSAAVYHVRFDSDGNITLTHSAIDSRNLIDTTRLNTGLHKALQGLFTAWDGLMFSPIFEGPDSLYRVHKRANGYEVSITPTDGKMSFILTRDFRFVTMSMRAGKLKVDRRVDFDSDSSVFIVKRIIEDYDHAMPLDDYDRRLPMHLEYAIQHWKVGGFPLPSFAHLKSEYGSVSAQAEFAFSDYRLKTR
jgi:hypothetical protein